MRINKGLFSGLALAAFCAPAMYAAPTQELTLSDGLGDSITCTYNTVTSSGSCTTTGTAHLNAATESFDGAGGITLNNSISSPDTLGSGATEITIKGVTGLGCGSLTCPPELENQVSTDASAGAGAVLTAQYTDTSYSDLEHSIILSGSESTATAAADTEVFTEFGANGAALPATGLIGALATQTGLSDNQTLSYANPYTGASASLTAQTVITFNAVGTINTTFDVSEVAVPEPTSVLYLGTMIFGMAMVFRKKLVNRS